MDAQVQSVLEGSPAWTSGLRAGDRVTSVNGKTDLEDLFDFRFELMMDETLRLNETVAIQVPDEAQTEIDLGIQFVSPLFTPIKTCNNACPFCFIDQQPEGLRPSLYIKDDDWRLSYFCNTYITLTNLTRRDRERISRIRPGPFYVSVHSTVPDIRAVLLKNPKAGEVMKELRWLADLEIPFHAQLVICPGINDGDSLSQSLSDLATLRPYCLSVAIVPVGFTHYRDTLPQMTAMTKEVALDILARLDAFKTENFAFASDEFYVRAEQSIPGYDTYGDFPQLDDGVGTARLLTEAFFELEGTFPETLFPGRRHIVLTGKLGEMVLKPIVQRLNLIEGLYLDLIAIENRFWGDAVTVSGLITGKDILEQLQPYDLSGYTSILIPETMLKSGDSLFLDGYCVEDLSEKLGCPIEVVKNPTQAKSLVDMLFTAS